VKALSPGPSSAPVETVAFLSEEEMASALVARLSQPGVEADPVLLARLLQAAARLPHQGPEILALCLQDAREEVRAAAAGSLPDWRPWPRALLACAEDPAPLVRASLAVALRCLAGSRQAQEVLARLARDPDPLVRCAATDSPEPPGDVLERARTVEGSLAEDPECWRAVLERCLRQKDGLQVLAAAAERATDPALRGLLQALGWLASGHEDSLAGACAALGGGGLVPVLAAWLSSCLAAARAESLQDVAAWLQDWDPGLAGRLSPHARLALAELRQVAGSRAEGELAALRLQALAEAAANWPLPERLGVHSVAAAWMPLLRQRCDPIELPEAAGPSCWPAPRREKKPLEFLEAAGQSFRPLPRETGDRFAFPRLPGPPRVASPDKTVDPMEACRGWAR
jgi:hypothetical protein